MATTSQNNLLRKPQELFVLPIDNTVNAGAINGGDACYFTSNQGIASYGSGNTFTAAFVALLGTFIGVSKDKNPLGSGGIINPLIYAGAQTAGVFGFNSTSGDTYKQFTPVTLSTDAQTIMIAPTPAAPGSTAVASGTGGTWSVGAHSVAYTWLTSLGETTPSTATSVTTTSGQNIVITLTSGYLPAYVLGVCVYVDGVFAGYVTTTSAATLAGPLAASYPARPLPIVNALAIGYVDLSSGATGTTAASPNIAGGATVQVPVRILPKYPALGLR